MFTINGLLSHGPLLKSPDMLTSAVEITFIGMVFILTCWLLFRYLIVILATSPKKQPAHKDKTTPLKKTFAVEKVKMSELLTMDCDSMAQFNIK